MREEESQNININLQMIPGEDLTHIGDSGSSAGSLAYATGRVPNKIKADLEQIVFGQTLGEGKKSNVF